MGNSQSSSIEEEYSNYIKEQQRIIESQQAQINQLYQNQNQTISPQNTAPPPPPEQPKKSKFEIILSVFGLDANYDEVSLKVIYKISSGTSPRCCRSRKV